ncbi:GNAT family N-acetyltransferase [Luteolibacter sp. Populi]|uniref:GNAT family N-acetyltransferase n=1 Tax=Luteolibacter sp. Populi TaxID=3230487 RepID=UPI003466796D
MKSESDQVQELIEHEIPVAIQADIARLLELCFPNTFEGRTYYKQLPDFRLLLWNRGILAGQLGIDSRMVNIGGDILRVFGIIDLCVHPQQRGEGIASLLLSKAEKIGQLHDRDFLVLMADRHEVYMKSGFTRVEPAHTKWLGIDERKSAGVIQRDLGDCFLIKPLSNRPWPSGEIDMLGYLF